MAGPTEIVTRAGQVLWVSFFGSPHESPHGRGLAGFGYARGLAAKYWLREQNTEGAPVQHLAVLGPEGRPHGGSSRCPALIATVYSMAGLLMHLQLPSEAPDAECFRLHQH